MSEAIGNDQSNFQEAMQAFFEGGGEPIKEVVPVPDEPKAEVATEVEPVAAVAEEVKPEADPALTPPPAEEVAKDTPVSPDVQKLIAREAEIQAREEKFKAAEADVRAVYNHMQEFERAKAEFFRDPAGFIRMLDPKATLASVAEALYHEEIGDKAPLEYQVKKQTNGVERRLTDLEKRLEEREQAIAAREQEQEVRQFRSNLVAQARALDEKQYPLLMGLSKRNAERFENLVFEEVRKTAVATNGQKVLTHAEAAAAVEAFLVKERDELFGTPAPKEQPKPPSGQVTVFNKSTAVQPQLTPDPDDDRALRKAALEAAGLGHLPVW